MGKLLSAHGSNSWFSVNHISYLPDMEGWCYFTIMCEHFAFNWNIMSYLVTDSLFSSILKSVLFQQTMLNCSVNSGNIGWSKCHATFTTNLLFLLKNSVICVIFMTILVHFSMQHVWQMALCQFCVNPISKNELALFQHYAEQDFTPSVRGSYVVFYFLFQINCSVPS
jgi:hypothetical protein